MNKVRTEHATATRTAQLRRAVWQYTSAMAIALSGLALATSASANDDVRGVEEPESKEIIVTARKREESIQSVPQSIDVLGGDQLTDMGKVTIKDLQFEVPGFYMQNFETRVTVALRGVGNQVPGSGQSVATHVNGIFQPSTASSLGWLFDVDRVEVLKGPQGTLYGRNSTGGALNIETRRPGNDFDVGAKLEYGSFDTYRAYAGMDIPLSDDWAVRVAGVISRSDGRLINTVINDTIDGNEYTGGRITLVGRVGSVDVEVFSQFSEETGGVGEIIPLNPSGRPLLGWNRTSLDQPTIPVGERQHFIASLDLQGELGGGFSWRSLTGFVDYREPAILVDVTPFPNPTSIRGSFPQYAEQFSQELQLIYTAENMNFVVGTLYMDAKEGEDRTFDVVPVLPQILNSSTDNKIETIGIFGDVNYNLNDKLRANIGLRYNIEKIDNQFVGRGRFDGPAFTASQTQRQLTGRVGLDYTNEAGSLFYVNASKGFQAGYTTNGFALDGTPAPAAVDPEILYAYEAGFKSTFPGGNGRLALAAFFYDYQDLQVRVGGIPLLPDGTPDPNGRPFFTVLNAAEARIWGLEASLVDFRLSENLKIDLVGGYLNAKFEDYQSIDDFTGLPADFSGNRLPRSPEFQGQVAVTLDNISIGPGDFSVRSEYQFRSDAFDRADNVARLGRTDLINILATYQVKDWSFQISGRNITNDRFFAFFDGRNFGTPGLFRTWLASVSYRY